MSYMQQDRRLSDLVVYHVAQEVRDSSLISEFWGRKKIAEVARAGTEDPY